MSISETLFQEVYELPTQEPVPQEPRGGLTPYARSALGGFVHGAIAPLGGVTPRGTVRFYGGESVPWGGVANIAGYVAGQHFVWPVVQREFHALAGSALRTLTRYAPDVAARVTSAVSSAKLPPRLAPFAGSLGWIGAAYAIGAIADVSGVLNRLLNAIGATPEERSLAADALLQVGGTAVMAAAARLAGRAAGRWTQNWTQNRLSRVQEAAEAIRTPPVETPPQQPAPVPRPSLPADLERRVSAAEERLQRAQGITQTEVPPFLRREGHRELGPSVIGGQLRLEYPTIYGSTGQPIAFRPPELPVQPVERAPVREVIRYGPPEPPTPPEVVPTPKKRPTRQKAAPQAPPPTPAPAPPSPKAPETRRRARPEAPASAPVSAPMPTQQAPAAPARRSTRRSMFKEVKGPDDLPPHVRQFVFSQIIDAVRQMNNRRQAFEDRRAAIAAAAEFAQKIIGKLRKMGYDAESQKDIIIRDILGSLKGVEEPTIEELMQQVPGTEHITRIR